MTGFAVRRRLTGVTLALLLQVVFFALLLRSLTRPPATIPENLAHELILILPRLREAQPPTVPSPQASQPSRAQDVHLPAVPFAPNAAAPLAAPQDLSRLGHGLKIAMIMFDTTTCGHTPPDTAPPSYMLPN